MQIGLIAAMSKELELLLPLLQNKNFCIDNGYKLHVGNIGDTQIVAIQSGIGKVNAAIATLTLINDFSLDYIINTGVAGGTGKANILDVVIPDKIAYHDVWCGPDTIEGQAAKCPPFFTCPLSDKTVKMLGAKQGLLASGDRFIDSADEIDRIVNLYPDAVAVDMESAAIAHVCHLKKIPFIAIRVISDTPGRGDNISQYTDFWSSAPVRSFETLSHLLPLLESPHT